ncbi:NAD-dependent epimerase/dehydratase family protein [Paludisphaera rhizosphaerae]|uniref:NAD-dependent epimerase/dehydratase family protein n=1 Tax=Paludisphaera rhizosphaerae TaxID=2711216 RepID=UPI0013EBB771|nr:NAD-dependent epimerase/dehydratase family protein [Paludisphaera rhizosphaerae]
MATWLITGAGGWLGGHVLESLEPTLAPDDRLVVLGRNRPSALPRGQFVSADLHDNDGLNRVVREVAPDFVLHLAGKTPPAVDDELYETNVRGTERLLEALRDLAGPTRVVVVGSAAELGPIQPADLPVVEDQPCRPTQAYGRSKLAATTLALRNWGELRIVVGRVFNLIGPGTPSSLAFGRFATQLAAAKDHWVEIQAGRLDSRRDFVDVRDAARALIALAERGRQGRVYNVASGRSYTIQDGLDRLVSLSGRTAQVAFDAGAQRAGEPDDTRADISRITAEVGWEPKIPFERSIADLWASALARNGKALPLTA